MAFLARDRGMEANEREMRHIMVKPYLLTPALVIMTILAGLALLTLMYIIVFMAIVAGGTDLDLIGIALMASATGGILVLAT